MSTTLDQTSRTAPARAFEPETAPLLEVRDLRVHFSSERGTVRAVDDVGFDVRPGEVLAIVGESGSGKSVTSLSIMGLIPSPPGRIAGGAIRFRGDDLLNKSGREMNALRGDRIAMIFQDPMTSLDPVFTVEQQMVEAITRHRQVGRNEARAIALETLAKVHIPDPERRLAAYPFQLSGGLRQRVMIAIALSCQPELLIADEPTTALDVTVQAQILALLKELQAATGMAIMLITHDFGVVARLADRVVVMYAGKVMETAPVREILADAQHPYTQALLKSRPKLGDKGALSSIPGAPPNLANPPPGCPFASRCAEMIDPCWAGVPAMRAVGPGHDLRCIRRGGA